jgi:hypothetical protein
MPAAARQITPADLIPDADYAKERRDRRLALLPIKRLRRVPLGPVCTFIFESYDTMLFQVQEMLLTEKGGAEQIPDELAAYNPLIPQGSERDRRRGPPRTDPRQTGRCRGPVLHPGRRHPRGRRGGRRRRTHPGRRQDFLGPLPALRPDLGADRPLPRPGHPDPDRLRPRTVQPSGRPDPGHPRRTGQGLRVEGLRRDPSLLDRHSRACPGNP